MKQSLTLLLAAFSCTLFSQSHTISGYIEDAASKERLIGVNVYLSGTSYGASTNTYGYYSLTVPEGEYTLVVSYIGYNTQRQEVNIDGDKRVDIDLRASSEELMEVEVSAEDESPVERAEMSTIRLGVSDIKKIPAFFGEVDIIRAIQLLPGVQSGNEGSTGFYVRGGSPDQNLILLDGVPVYNASHLFGFFSVFNADAVKNVQLTKGGFPARFGGRLSSVLEIDMKEGNMKEFHGEGSIGVISSKFTLEGPIVEDKTSFIVSGRRTYYDFLIKPFLPDDLSTGYYFYDVTAKVNHIFSRKDRLYISYYSGLDRFYFSETYDYSSPVAGGTEFRNTNDFSLDWGNHTGSVRWNHLFSEKLFGNLTATYTQYRFTTGYENERTDLAVSPPSVENIGFRYSSRIRDVGLKYDLEYALNSKHSLRAGANYTYHVFKPGVAQFNTEFSGIRVDSLLNLSDEIHSHDSYLYLEDDWQINERWRANYGLHYSAYFTGEAFYHALQPRLSARYMVSDDWSVKASYAKMNQYIHLLSNTGIGLPTDLWVSSTENVKPQISQQVALGTVKNFAEEEYEFSTEAYYKRMDNLIEYKEGASFISNTDWQNNVETDGQGWAYGLEVLFRKNEGKLTGWVGYTIAKTTRQFSNLNNGKPFPYKYDRRHDVSLVLNYKINDRFDIGGTWVYGTGNTFTAPIANYFLQNSNSFYWQETFQRYTDRNALRLPAYHRMDIGFNYHQKTSWGEATWNLSIYNAYNRRNPFFLFLNEDYQGNKTVQQVSLFPIIPAVTYIFKF